MYAADESDPRAAPLTYPSHENLPPAYIHVMGADPLRDALARFERPATVISESPDEESSQAIRAILVGG